MRTIDATAECQVPGLHGGVAGGIAFGEDGRPSYAEMPPQSISRRVKLFIRRHMNPQTERKFKARTNDLMNWICRMTGKPERPLVIATAEHAGAAAGTSSGVDTKSAPTVRLEAGDWVRVRPREEIDATLNHWRQLRGCTFMPEMDAYCGTVQRVLKPLRRFVDERDLTVKTAKGIVLLDGVVCQGTTDFGPCDRSCVLFWREEWLEKIERPEAAQ